MVSESVIRDGACIGIAVLFILAAFRPESPFTCTTEGRE